MRLKSRIGKSGALALILIAVLALSPPAAAQQTNWLSFDPTLSLTAVLPSGSLGLPGESINWVITVSNPGASAGTNVVVSDTLQPELRIDRAETAQGEAVISEQMVVFTIPVLNPGESVRMQIATTVLKSPPEGIMVNQALLAATGPDGAITRKATTELSLPVSLPATGYVPPAEPDFPGEGEPSALQIALAAVGVVMLGAAVVWYRGRKRWLGRL